MRIEINTHNRTIWVWTGRRAYNDAEFESKHPRDKDGKFATGNIAEHVDFHEIPQSVSQKLTDAIQDNIKKYPFMQGHFSFIGSAHAKLAQDLGDNIGADENVEAFYKPEPLGGRGRICFSAEALQRAETRAQILAKANHQDTTFHPPGTNTIKGIVDHEFAHAIWHRLALDDYKKGIKPIHKYIIKYIAEHSQDDIAKNLSRYAKTNAAEFFAEAFSELQNNSNPRPLAKKIGELLDAEIKSQNLDAKK